MLRRFARRTPAAAALAVLAGCLSPNPTAPELLAARTASVPAAGEVSVMTQNMYVGADLDAVIGALASPDPNDDVPALLHAVATLGTTDYPARAGAFAQAIGRARPQILGLQEVSQIDIDLSALGLPTQTHLDFLAILADSLAARGLHYVVAAKVQNIVARPIAGIGLVDYDAMLVDADRVSVVAAAGQNYAAADVSSPRSVAAYVVPSLFLALVVDRVVAVVRRHVLGAEERSVWSTAGRASAFAARGLGLVLLYALRFVLAPPSTGAGLRRVVLNAAPVPAPPVRLVIAPEEVLPIEPPVTEPPELEGASKKARLAWWYEQDPGYCNRAAVAAAAKRLAPKVDLSEGTARAYLGQICDDLERERRVS